MLHVSAPAPLDKTAGYTVEVVWKPTTFDRWGRLSSPIPKYFAAA